MILSCSHVFHRDCLRSWEAFSQNQKGAKTCPCCRRESYQKRTFAEGGEIYRAKCAVRIQTAWRGTLARRRVEKLWMATNPTKRRAYCERRLGQLTDRLTSGLVGHDSNVDDFLSELDTSLAASRAVFAAADIDWTYTVRLAHGMAPDPSEHVCSICLGRSCPGGGQCDSPQRGPPRKLTLLPCGHVFHYEGERGAGRLV